MDKRYQVFISSTFQDLQEARNAVLQSLLRMRHIPAGMELFPAIDEEQMRYIRRVIDESDYYLLIIGGRYGSLSAQGVSYTEDEYDYAVKTGKPVLAFIHDKPEELPAKFTDSDPELQKKLAAFCEKVKTGGRIVRFWHDVKDLRAEVAESLPQTITARPAIGWVRGNTVASADLTAEQNALLKERDSLKAENEKLKIELDKNKPSIPDIAGLDDVTPAELWQNNTKTQQNIVKATWRDLFTVLTTASQLIRDEVSSNYLRDTSGFDPHSWERICMQFEELGLIRIIPKIDLIKNRRSYYWNLTNKGQKMAREALIIRKPDKEAENS